MSATTQNSTETSESNGLLGTFGLRGELFAAQLLNFTVILVVMWRWVYRPLMKKMDERTKRISEGLEHSKEADERLKSARTESGRALNEARAEARTVLDQAAAKVETLRQEKLKQAREEIEKVIAEAKEQIKSERQAAYASLQKDVAELVSLATAKVATGLDEKTHRSLIQSALKEIENA